MNLIPICYSYSQVLKFLNIFQVVMILVSYHIHIYLIIIIQIYSHSLQGLSWDI
jgi:hypothetical protein